MVACAHFLFVPMIPLGPRLIQPVTYSRSPTDDAAPVIGDQAASVVERQSGHGASAVADRAEHEARRQRLGCARRACGERPVLAKDELVDRYDDALDAAVADDLHRGAQEAQRDRPGPLASRARAAKSCSTAMLRFVVGDASSSSAARL